ncbi:guanine nucleotide-binding protein subunit alpha [Cladochytrium tenue]|nr:guanine nucleotide-binding protein subunit alpha [Cladochytrium tenue]
MGNCVATPAQGDRLAGGGGGGSGTVWRTPGTSTTTSSSSAREALQQPASNSTANSPTPAMKQPAHTRPSLPPPVFAPSSGPTPRAEAAAAARRSRGLDAAIRAERRARDATIKLLLLGPGESGKSTVLKQFRLINGVGFSYEERSMYGPAVKSTLVQSAKALVTAMDTLQIPYGFDPTLHLSFASLSSGNVPRVSFSSIASSSSQPGLSTEGMNRPRTDRPAKAARIAFETLLASPQTSTELGTTSVDSLPIPSVRASSSASSTAPLVVQVLGGADSSAPISPPLPSPTSPNATGIEPVASSPSQHPSILRPSKNAVDRSSFSTFNGVPPVLPLQTLQNGRSLPGPPGNVRLPPALTPEGLLAARASLIIAVSPSFYGEDEHLAPELVDAIKIMCYFESIDRISQEDFVPTNMDILQTRIMTTSVTETRFVMDGGVTFRIFDLGGQRNERKKWFPYFDDVAAIIFVAAISAFDQTCHEDGMTNRVVEALALFESVCGHPLFRNTSVILFLNKIDLFQAKLARSAVAVRDYFPSYTGENSYEPASEYFASRFMALNRVSDRKFYVHFTCSTDTKKIKVVLTTVNTIILRQNLEDAGL